MKTEQEQPKKSAEILYEIYNVTWKLLLALCFFMVVESLQLLQQLTSKIKEK